MVLTFLIALIPITYLLFFFSKQIFSSEIVTEDRLIDVYDDGVWYQVLGLSTENNSQHFSKKNIRLIFNDEEKNIETEAVKLSEVFAENGIFIGQYDIVEPHLLAPVFGGMTVKIIRVNKIQEIQEKPIPVLTEYRENNEMLLGQEAILQKGIEGVRELTIEKVFEDGELVSEEVIAERVLLDSVVRIIEKGTKVIILDTQYGVSSYYTHPRYIGKLIAAHRTYLRGSMLRVTNLRNDKSVVVKVVDYGPQEHTGKIIDLSLTAFRAIEYPSSGWTSVRVELLQQ